MMGKQKNFRLEEANRLVKWILDNPGKWNMFIDSGDMNRDAHFVDLLKILKDAEFYQLILVLLAINQFDFERRLCKKTIEKVRNQFIWDAWNKESILHITDAIIREQKNPA